MNLKPNVNKLQKSHNKWSFTNYFLKSFYHKDFSSLKMTKRQKMKEAFVYILGNLFIVVAGLYAQVSNMTEGILDRGFDAGLSIGLLIIGIVVLAVHHWRYIKYTREEFAALSKAKDDKIAELSDRKDDKIELLTKEKDEKISEYHELMLSQLEMQKEQNQINKDLRTALVNLTDKIDMKTKS